MLPEKKIKIQFSPQKIVLDLKCTVIGEEFIVAPSNINKKAA